MLVWFFIAFHFGKLTLLNEFFKEVLTNIPIGSDLTVVKSTASPSAPVMLNILSSEPSASQFLEFQHPVVIFFVCFPVIGSFRCVFLL